MSAPDATWVSIADTAVKIGLGAAISGVFGWLIARHTTRSAITKLIFERRSDRLATVAEQYEAFFQAYLKYTNLLSGLASAGASASRDDPTGAVYPQMLAQGATDATRLKGEMFAKMELTFYGQSTLMLLGETECREAAEKLLFAITYANQKIKFDGATVDLTALPQCHAAVSAARKTFYSEMAKAFRKI